ncbi:Na+/H+ antiporter [Baekduia sp. Peel2402]|uniref:Na+/H+ antiporter n=1 Tax=Baekduia sp. Peel2402 TaxID=3458296 RepID=UPI00403EA4A7
MELTQVLIAVLLAVALLAWGARAIGVPYPIVQVLGGAALAFIPGAPDVVLDPDIVFLIFVPPLVHAAAYKAGHKRLMDRTEELGILAIGLVAVTVVAAAAVAHGMVDGMTWPAAFALGAAIAPTDAIAATAVFRRLGAPERVLSVVEGESLVNDATGLVTLRLAIAAGVAGTFSAWHGVGEFFWVSLAGVLVGALGGRLASWLRQRIDDSLIEITVTLLTPYAVYVGAEELHVSGVLAAVVSGFFVAQHDSRLASASVRLEGRTFWDILTFLMESALFVLVGFQARDTFEALTGSVGQVVGAAFAVVATITAVRILVSLVLWRLPVRERLVVGWSGMRGAISLAAALSIPLTIDGGGAFPVRDEILAITMIVIAVTLVGQGLTLGFLARWLLPADATVPSERASAMARFETVTAVLDRIADVPPDSEISPAIIERARELYSTRAQQLAGACRLGVADEQSDVAAWLRFRVHLLAVERSALADARNDGSIDNSVKLAVDRELDLEEERLRARLAA